MNLGNDALNGAQSLRGHPDFEKLRDGIAAQVQAAMHKALNCEPAHREYACGFAAGLNELHIALSARLEHSGNHNQVPKLAPAKGQG